MEVSGRSDLVRRRVKITGRVQGVFFRASTREQAAQRGVSGWVRNLADGRVQAEFEAPSDAVDSLIAWIERGGPAGARVDQVEITELPPTGALGFEVR